MLHWLPTDLILPDEGHEVVIYAPTLLGLRKGYYLEGKWYDLYHRHLHGVQSWKPGPDPKDSDSVTALQYAEAYRLIQTIIESYGNHITKGL